MMQNLLTATKCCILIKLTTPLLVAKRGDKMRKFLIWLRKSKNLTQQQVADDLGISRGFYGMIENGIRNPTLELAQRIAEYFDTDVRKIFLIIIATK
jgi:putative transcriptional regulator